MNIFKSFLNIGVNDNQNVFEVRLIRAVNILSLNAIVSILSVGIFGYFIQQDPTSLYILLSLPLYFGSIYLNSIYKSLPAITVLFVTSALMLTLYSIWIGEESFTHSLFILNIIGLALLYRKETVKFYFILNMLFTMLCIGFVLLAYQYNWFPSFRNPYVVPEDQRQMNYIILIFCSLLFSLVVVISFRAQHRDMERSLEEQRVLLSEVHHRVKNNMAVIISLLNLQKGVSNHPETKDALQDIHDRLMSMALVHHKMYQNENQSLIELDTYVTDLIAEIKNSLDINRNITIRTEIEQITLDISKTIPLGLILNELITNAVKYAFVNVENPEIVIVMRKLGDESIELIVEDNGVGASVESLKKNNSLGLSLIQSLTEQIDGLCTFESNNGLTFSLAFPAFKSSRKG